MYRLLDAAKAVRERRNQRRGVVYQKPQLLAERPNQVWSWDISVPQGTKEVLRGKLNALCQSCMKDGGRSSGVGLQGQDSNHHELRELNAVVVSVIGKGAFNASGTDQEGEHK